MNSQRGPYYITYDVAWAMKSCPRCKQRPATGHGWLFKDSPPMVPALDKRKPIGEVFIHDDGADCTILSESEKSR